MPRWGMVIDLSRCIGCHACTYACKAEHTTGKGVFWTFLYDYERGKYPKVIRSFLPVLCMHCEHAPCEHVCPSRATHKRADGIVAIDQNKCIRCRACMVACPYHARFENPVDTYPAAEGGQRRGCLPLRQPGIVEKCNFCNARIERGIAHGLTPGLAWDANPVCVNACPVNARAFGDLDNPQSEISKRISSEKAEPLHKEFETSPSVYYIADGRSRQK